MPLTPTQIKSSILAILADMTQDWDLELDGIGPQTQLVADLSFASVDVISLVVALEEHFKRKLGFDQLLMRNGRYVDDLSVDEVVNFVASKLQVEPA